LRQSQTLDLTPKVVVRTCNGVELRDLGGRRRTPDVETGGGGAVSRSGRDRIGNRLASSSASSNVMSTWQNAGAGVSGPATSRAADDDDVDADTSTNNFSPEVVRAIEGVKFIAEHLKQEDEARYVSSAFRDYLYTWATKGPVTFYSDKLDGLIPLLHTETNCDERS